MHAKYENHYLTDQDIANFARQSFGKLAENFTPEQNNKLVQFLARGMKSGDWDALVQELFNLGKVDYGSPEGSPMEADNIIKAKELMVYLRTIPEHWVPFGHPQISLRMNAPLPIRTQCFKHKIGFVESEESRRYIKTTPTLFIPDEFRSEAKDVKQGSAGAHPESDSWRQAYIRAANQAMKLYEAMIAAGVCAEQARFVLPQGCEVNWVWTGSLYAYANYVNKRREGHSQQESQDLAKEVSDIIAPLYPVAWAALTGGKY